MVCGSTTEFVVKYRGGKTYERASNACVNLFLALVKSFQIFTLFCCKNEFCCNFAFYRVILMVFRLVNRNFYF